MSCANGGEEWEGDWQELLGPSLGRTGCGKREKITTKACAPMSWVQRSQRRSLLHGRSSISEATTIPPVTKDPGMGWAQYW